MGVHKQVDHAVIVQISFQFSQECLFLPGVEAGALRHIKAKFHAAFGTVHMLAAGADAAAEMER